MDNLKTVKCCSNCERSHLSELEYPCCRCKYNGGEIDFWVEYKDLDKVVEDVNTKLDLETANDPKTRADFLKMVEGIICKDRNTQYGEPEDNFGRIAKFWSDYLETSIDAADVAIMMSLFKIARIATGGNKSDNWIDLIGYAACGAECAVKREG